MAPGEDGHGVPRDSIRAVVAAIGIDGPWLDGVAEKISAAIGEELPELRGDEELEAATLQSSRSILGLFLATVESDLPAKAPQPPPQAVAYAHEFVRRGLPVEILIRTYQVGQACFYRCFAEAAKDSLDDPNDVATAMEQGARWSFEFVDGLLLGLLRHYGEERDRWVRSAAAVRWETIRGLLAGEATDPQQAAARLSYRLEGHHRAFVLWIEDDAAGGAGGAMVESAAAELTDRLGAANRLLVPGGPSLVYGWIGSDATTTLPEDLVAPGTVEGTRAAFGTDRTGVDGFVRSHREAMDARRVARHSGSTGSFVLYSEVSLLALATVDPTLARTFVIDELGALAGADAATRQLRETALVYLENFASPLRTAQALDVHANTIYNRIRRAEQLLGRPIDERLTETLVALRLALLEVGDPGPRGGD